MELPKRDTLQRIQRIIDANIRPKILHNTPLLQRRLSFQTEQASSLAVRVRETNA